MRISYYYNVTLIHYFLTNERLLYLYHLAVQLKSHLKLVFQMLKQRFLQSLY